MNIARIQRVVETGHGVTARIGDLLHLRELLGAAGRQVQERETIEVLRTLVCLLYNLGARVRQSATRCITYGGLPCGCLASEPAVQGAPSSPAGR